MIKIYGSIRGSAARCVWFAEELGLPYEVVPVDMANGEHKKPEYLQINPNGKVPTMVDGDVVLWESLAICYYMMEKSGKFEFVGTTAKEHGLVNQWSLWALIHLYAEGFSSLVLQKFRNTPDSEATKNAREVALPRFLPVLENRLQGREYVALDGFTLADLVLMSVVNSVHFVGYDMTAYPNIVGWMKKIAERPAFKKILG